MSWHLYPRGNNRRYLLKASMEWLQSWSKRYAKNKTSLVSGRNRTPCRLSCSPSLVTITYRGADKSLARQEANKLMFLSQWREFPSTPCLAGGGDLMTARVSMLLKSRASLTRFRDCFLPGQAKELSAPRYTAG